MDLQANAKKLKIALLIAALTLCLGVFPALPGFFYILLRWVVCGAAVYGAVNFRGAPRMSRHFWVVAVLAALFNPLFPVALTPLLWLLLDLGTAVYFLILSRKF